VDAVALGTPFEVQAAWRYERVTTGAAYTHPQTDPQTDTNANVHVLSQFKITAPDVVRTYAGERFIVSPARHDRLGRGPDVRWRAISPHRAPASVKSSSDAPAIAFHATGRSPASVVQRPARCSFCPAARMDAREQAAASMAVWRLAHRSPASSRLGGR
jgi:hypothetical protein